MSQITKEDALLAIDGAMAALSSARVMVDAIGDDPSASVGGCPHLRRTATFRKVLCEDCGATLGEPESDEGAPVDTISVEVV